VRKPFDVQNDPDLLALLLRDAESAKEPWNVTPFWSNYHDRIVRALQRDGVARLQNNYQLLKGYADGGVPTLVPPSNAVKRAVFETIPRVPLVSRVISEYKGMLATEHGRLKLVNERLSRFILADIQDLFPDFKPPRGILAGHPAHFFEWNGGSYTASFVSQLSRVADFYKVVPRESVTSLLEVGPGLGLSSLAHAALNPHLRLIINVDIPSTIYVATQFLKAVDAFDVIDYQSFRKSGGFDGFGSGNTAGNADRLQCIQLPPWACPEIQSPIDWAHNAFSFMEMEPAVVEAYAEVISSNVTGGIWLLSAVQGHLPNSGGGQKARVTFDLIEQAFNPQFERETVEMVNFSSYFNVIPDHSRLLRRAGHP